MPLDRTQPLVRKDADGLDAGLEPMNVTPSAATGNQG